MRKILFAIVLLAAAVLSCGRQEPARPYTVNHPAYMFGYPDYMPPKAQGVFLDSVIVTDNETILCMTNNILSKPGVGVRISDHSSIAVAGHLYPLRRAEGVQPGPYIVNTDAEPKTVFTSIKLYFDPVPKGTRKISFMEGHFSTGFHYFNIELY